LRNCSIAARDPFTNAAEHACPAVAPAGSVSRHKLTPANAELANKASIGGDLLGIPLCPCARASTIILGVNIRVTSETRSLAIALSLRELEKVSR
jgi:hypothetical protein